MKLFWYSMMALALWNLFTFCLMGWDKRQAMHQGWRIPEKRLFLFSFCFGGLGVALGMSVFRHKTKHTSFRVLVPLSIFVNGAVIGILLWQLQPWR